MTHDLIFLLGFVTLGALVLLGSRYLDSYAYSKLLAVVIILAMVVMVWFHAIAIRVEGDSQVHFIVLAIAQFWVLALSFKLWFSLNYPRFNRALRVSVHVLSHASLAVSVFAGYWLKTAHPVIVFLLYPLSSLSVALIAESIEEAAERRAAKATSTSEESF
jgi:cation transport ATPase